MSLLEDKLQEYLNINKNNPVVRLLDRGVVTISNRSGVLEHFEGLLVNHTIYNQTFAYYVDTKNKLQIVSDSNFNRRESSNV